MTVFVGISDGEELGLLGKKAKKQGAVIGINAQDVLPHILSERPDTVIIQGGYLFVCVSEIAQGCFDEGINVIIDLPRCRVNNVDIGDHNNLGNRLNELELGLEKKLYEIPELRVTT